MCSPRRLAQAGFTVVEALVATSISLVAVAALMSFHVMQMYAMLNQSTQVDLQTSARTIADLFANEVRRAGTGTNPTCTGTTSTGILLASNTQIRVRADLDGNGVLTGSNEDVTYTLSTTNNNITRTDNNAGRTDTLWSGASISGSQITYYDSTGTQLSTGTLSATDLVNVTRVRLQLALKDNAFKSSSAAQQTAKESAEAEIRNRYLVMTVCKYN
jgi:Tfp pilus assembly protein PilW